MPSHTQHASNSKDMNLAFKNFEKLENKQGEENKTKQILNLLSKSTKF